ncbi:uncharacterized protein Dmoj_GI11315, isoform B [Drosophila mojavensis]|uniref:Uncharacterized protein, isoform B n=1 Tax=Drosophila mojavensis TaxID=7230 RepID=A0A0Q9XPB2_DROMO|nr:uncharacterized protein Dmoj_GI11315, isoform B [Drosophila mojavensis]
MNPLDKIHALDEIEKDIILCMQSAGQALQELVSTGQPHEGSGYASAKVLQMAWHRIQHARSRVRELEETKAKHSHAARQQQQKRQQEHAAAQQQQAAAAAAQQQQQTAVAAGGSGSTDGSGVGIGNTSSVSGIATDAGGSMPAS